jgi:hypothetical protein
VLNEFKPKLNRNGRTSWCAEPPYQPPNPLEMPLRTLLQASLAAVRRLFLLPLPLPRFLQGAAAVLGERQ